MTALTFEFKSALQTAFRILAASEDAFPVDFDNVVKWLRLPRRDHAKRKLIKDFTEDKDYTQKSCSPTLGSKHGGSNKIEIFLTVNCFKKYCLMARSKVGSAVRDYFIEVENQARQFCQDIADGKIDVQKRDTDWTDARSDSITAVKACTASLQKRSRAVKRK